MSDMMKFGKSLGYDNPQDQTEKEKQEAQGKLAKLRQELKSLEEWLANVEMGSQMESGGTAYFRDRDDSSDTSQGGKIRRAIAEKKREISILEKAQV